MEWINIGKIVNTHGIKGELRLISDFDKKEIVFQKGFSLYIGMQKQPEILSHHRIHKNFNMFTLEGYDNINQVLDFIGQNVYIKREDLNLKTQEYLLADLKDCTIVENQEKIGKVIDIMYNKAGILLQVKHMNGKNFYIPNNSHFIKKVFIEKKEIQTKHTKDLML